MDVETPGHLIARREAGDPSVTIQDVEKAALMLFAPEAKVSDVVYMPAQPAGGRKKHRFELRFKNGAKYSMYFEGGQAT